MDTAGKTMTASAMFVVITMVYWMLSEYNNFYFFDRKFDRDTIVYLIGFCEVITVSAMAYKIYKLIKK